MNITVLAVGKLKERWYREACDEYLKRLSAYAKLRVREVSDRDPASCGGEAPARDREGADLLRALRKDDHVVLLDIGGTERSSEDLSRHLADLALHGKVDLVFVIGGSTGVSDAVRHRSDERLSFGPLTLPHELARVVLLEQLYRSFRISRGEPYHK